ncbi:thiamine-phosphate kinase [uncultured Ferrimonas sp.]|uniref:thiamine-phosphate kinase n=1 Tax=uncultured Ferrimonas sp. TaxID=432640 RepID=UPI0026337D88|nr:thiamine-phosphate kinase [uncultured Ferrimonas sp.]
MSTGEFSIIERFFTHRRSRKDVVLGVGDDGAILAVPEGHHLVVSTDTLVSGIHFFADICPAKLAVKTVAVNLSDLAAMGAEPAWMTLAITMPDVDEGWLSEFARGLEQVCDYYGVALVGGDTTRGPLSLTVTMQGHVPINRALRRDGAKIGDWIYLTGAVGDSGAGLQALYQGEQGSQWQPFIERHLTPKPRLAAGIALRGIASAAMDLSDGLGSDLGHILRASGVAAQLEVDQIPLNPQLIELVGREQALQLALGGGEDYELLFTVSDSDKGTLATAMAETGSHAICIGQIVAGSGISYRRNGQEVDVSISGYNHFKENQ